MSRPKPDLPSAEAIRSLVDAQGRLSLRVTPGARAASITLQGAGLLVKVRAKPEAGAANEAVLDLVATALGIATSRLHMLRGTTSREKVIQLRD